MQRKKSAEEIRRKELLKELIALSGTKTSEDAQDLIKELLSDTLESMLEGELEEELGYSKYDYANKRTNNSRNGYRSKSVKTSNGEIKINVPRDRNGEYEPELIPNHQKRLSGDIEDKILSMYAKGMSQRDISDHIQDIYGFSVSDSVVSRITDKILPIAREWQNRPLSEIYAVVFLDAFAL